MTDDAPLHTKFRLTVEVLSPLHIGTGDTLISDIDYVTQDGRTWVINDDALFEAFFDDESLTFRDERVLLRSSAADLLAATYQNRPYDEESGLFRYALDGIPTAASTQAAQNPLREQIKTVYDEPYLPGTSLKGALRTLFFWGYYRQTKRYSNPRDLNRSAKFAGQRWERDAFVPSGERQGPNYDLMRAVHVADSKPAHIDDLYIATAVRAASAAAVGRQIGVNAETVRPGTTFSSTLTIDNYGLTNADARQELQWKRAFDLLVGRIVAIGNTNAGGRLVRDRSRFKQNGSRDAEVFCARQIKWIQDNAGDEANTSWLMQMSWGAGWQAKTLDDQLEKHPQINLERDIIEKYRLARRSRQPGDPFPKTRYFAPTPNGEMVPMGWVRCTLAPA